MKKPIGDGPHDESRYALEGVVDMAVDDAAASLPRPRTQLPNGSCHDIGGLGRHAANGVAGPLVSDAMVGRSSSLIDLCHAVAKREER